MVAILLALNTWKLMNMPKDLIRMNGEVTNFLDQLNHPFRKEIDQLRNDILSASADLTENIKWNGPNYCVGSEDRITMRIHPPAKQVQLIFHRGAKKLAQPNNKLIASNSKWLVWKENDRAIATFKSMQEIENGKAELAAIVDEWIKATS